MLDNALTECAACTTPTPYLSPHTAFPGSKEEPRAGDALLQGASAEDRRRFVRHYRPSTGILSVRMGTRHPLLRWAEQEKEKDTAVESIPGSEKLPGTTKRSELNTRRNIQNVMKT